MVEDENGNIVRETMKDTDTLARYKTMHETLVYLSHLDHDDTESQMLEKLRLQVSCAGQPAHPSHMTGSGQEPRSLAESAWESPAPASPLQPKNAWPSWSVPCVSWVAAATGPCMEALLCSLGAQSTARAR